MKKLVMILISFVVIFSCTQDIDLYKVLIQNNSSTTVSGIITVTNEDDKSFTVSAGKSVTIGVSTPYTVSYKNQYGKIKGTISYSTNKIIFVDNPGITLRLKNIIQEDVYIFTGGYIKGEIITAGKYKVDGTEGVKVDKSAESTDYTIYTEVPSFIVKTAQNINAYISWTIDMDADPHVMTGIIHY
jgi:hypothetical protein